MSYTSQESPVVSFFKKSYLIISFQNCTFLHIPTRYDNWLAFHVNKEHHWSIFLRNCDVLLVLLVAVVMMHVRLSLSKYLDSAALPSRWLWSPGVDPDSRILRFSVWAVEKNVQRFRPERVQSRPVKRSHTAPSALFWAEMTP